MKLTKGKIAKLYNKHNQTVKVPQSKKKITASFHKRSKRRRHFKPLERQTLKQLL